MEGTIRSLPGWTRMATGRCVCVCMCVGRHHAVIYSCIELALRGTRASSVACLSCNCVKVELGVAHFPPREPRGTPAEDPEASRYLAQQPLVYSQEGMRGHRPIRNTKSRGNPNTDRFSQRRDSTPLFHHLSGRGDSQMIAHMSIYGNNH